LLSETITQNACSFTVNVDGYLKSTPSNADEKLIQLLVLIVQLLFVVIQPLEFVAQPLELDAQPLELDAQPLEIAFQGLTPFL
jgi:hypothetical protein